MKSVAKKLVRNRFVEKAYHAIPFKKEIFASLKKTGLIPESMQWYLRFKGEFNISSQLGSTFKMYNPGFFIENNIFWNGIDDCWEKESLKIWQQLAANSNTIFDIGSNTGVYALLAKAANPSAQVFAIEPLPRIYRILEKNNVINQFNINCLNYALSDFDGEATFYDVDTLLGDVSSASLSKNFQQNQIELQVPVKKLASLVEELNLQQIDLLKIDVETFEPQVLKGFQPYLQQFKPALLIEVLEDKIGAQIEAAVQNLGYLYFDIDDERGLFQKEHITKSTHFNYLLCSKEKAVALSLI